MPSAELPRHIDAHEDDLCAFSVKLDNLGSTLDPVLPLLTPRKENRP